MKTKDAVELFDLANELVKTAYPNIEENDRHGKVADIIIALLDKDEARSCAMLFLNRN